MTLAPHLGQFKVASAVISSRNKLQEQYSAR